MYHRLMKRIGELHHYELVAVRALWNEYAKYSGFFCMAIYIITTYYMISKDLREK